MGNSSFYFEKIPGLLRQVEKPSPQESFNEKIPRGIEPQGNLFSSIPSQAAQRKRALPVKAKLK